MSGFTDLRSQFTGAEPARSLTPLFWVRGEPPELLLAEIARMDEAGMAGFVVESRTHPEFLGDWWWQDLEAIVDEASRRDMKVWLMDDEHYPSGYAAGAATRHRPDLLKRYLAERHVDLQGPLPYASFAVEEIGSLIHSEELIAVVVGRCPERDRAAGEARYDVVDGESLVDLTESVRDGMLRWAVPAGGWRLFVIVTTREGGEPWTRDFIDPLSEEAVDFYVETVHAAVLAHLGRHVGVTFQGFFTDEPRFGNAPSYESMPGEEGQVLPFTRGLLEAFAQRAGYAPRRWLPALWYDCGPRTDTVRHDYMDLVSARFADVFTRRIGDWCRGHGVRFIGHLVEDNGAHARLGYGAGHFFRCMAGLDMGGLDVVGYQVRPGFTSGHMASAFGRLDMKFFNWALAKLASSAAHHTPRMGGLTMAESYGAFGWAEGLKMLKWITDWMCVRGVNFIVPHAFSPAAFPDPDCPPQFYAGGHHPQWPFFRDWADYANRTCRLLTGGQHVAEVLVLYPAESSWAGPADGCEHAVAALAEAHLDCDICSYDDFCDSERVGISAEGRLICAGEQYSAVVLPAMERISPPVLERLIACREAGVLVACAGGVPVLPCRDDNRDAVARLSARLAEPAVGRAPAPSPLPGYAGLGRLLCDGGLGDVSPEAAASALRHYHYRRDGTDIYFLTNESVAETVDTWVVFRAGGVAELWDPLTAVAGPAVATATAGGTRVHVRLEPYQSTFLVFDTQGLPRATASDPRPAAPPVQSLPVEGPWQVDRAAAEEYPAFTAEPRVHGLGDWTVHDGLRRFAGTLRYRATISIPDVWRDRAVTLDLGEVYELARVRVNGLQRGVCLCPPYRCLLGAVPPGVHLLEVEVTNTLGTQVLDPFSRVVAGEPSGLLGPVELRLEGPEISARRA